MRILFDTNVVLDLLLDRKTHSEDAARLFASLGTPRVFGYLCATTVTTIHYLAGKVIGSRRAAEEIEHLLSLVEVAPVNRSVLESALRSKLDDFEDAVLAESARQANVEAIVTRNLKDFRSSLVPAYSPKEMLMALEIQEP